MRHFMTLTKALTVTPGSFGMGKAAATTVLITRSGLP